MNNKKLIIISASIIVILLFIYIVALITNNVNKEEYGLLKDGKQYFKVQEILNTNYSEDNYFDTSYIVTSIYYKEDKINTVYFIDAYRLLNDGFNIQYEDGFKYLMKQKGIYYSIERLDSSKTEKMLEDYVISDFNDKTNIIPSSNYNEKSKLEFYISVVNNLYSSNKNKAESYISNSYTNVSNKIDSYTVKDKTYSITTSNNEKITIIENSYMDFKIEY